MIHSRACCAPTNTVVGRLPSFTFDGFFVTRTAVMSVPLTVLPITQLGDRLVRRGLMLEFLLQTAGAEVRAEDPPLRLRGATAPGGRQFRAARVERSAWAGAEDHLDADLAVGHRR